ncbi:alpha/beta fold hydrolase [Streptomyces sp. GMY02]|uniref:alpha/beta fold hydrolase n=1 Tax=Streptomyces sp. GMY02 TaxID=1333528 RepID=UPI00349F371F
MTLRTLRSTVGPDFTLTDALVDRVHHMMNLPGNRDAFIDLSRTDQVDRSAELTRLEVPTLVLRGGAIDVRHLARDIPHATDIVLPGVGHLMPDEAPEQVAEAITVFVKENR